jgi:phage-related protein
MEVVFYKKSSGRSPVESFLQDLSVRDRAKIAGCLESVEELGFGTPRVEFRQIRGKLWEVKILAASGKYRIFYVTLLEGKTIVLLHVFLKKTGKTPKTEIEIAERRMKEVIDHEQAYT